MKYRINLIYCIWPIPFWMCESASNDWFYTEITYYICWFKSVHWYFIHIKMFLGCLGAKFTPIKRMVCAKSIVVPIAYFWGVLISDNFPFQTTDISIQYRLLQTCNKTKNFVRVSNKNCKIMLLNYKHNSRFLNY